MEGTDERADHHREAERLLSEARKEQDSIRRSLILAEAQVHATLALSTLPELRLTRATLVPLGAP